jgi:hypothetical protein
LSSIILSTMNIESDLRLMTYDYRLKIYDFLEPSAKLSYLPTPYCLPRLPYSMSVQGEMIYLFHCGLPRLPRAVLDLLH